jgi:hypothetical protein
MGLGSGIRKEPILDPGSRIHNTVQMGGLVRGIGDKDRGMGG